MSIKAIGYTRSPIKNHESIAAQLMAINEYCLKRGYVLGKSCLDTSSTCSDFAKLLADVSSAHYDVLVIKSLDRLSRDVSTLMNLTRELLSIGVRLETVDSEDTFLTCLV